MTTEESSMERAGRISAWVTGVVLIAAWLLFPRPVFWILVVIVTAACLVSLVAGYAYWQNKATMLYGDLVFTQASRDALRAENARLKRDNTELTLAYSRQNVRLGVLAEEHSKCGLTPAPKLGRVLRSIPPPRDPGAVS